MSYRSHWSSPGQISVETMPANNVPGAADDVGEDDVLVLFDHGNQEAMVFEGSPEDWSHLAGLIDTRIRFYNQGVR